MKRQGDLKMDVETTIDAVINFYHSQPVITIIIILVLIALSYFRPKPMLRLAGIALVFLAILYLLSLLGDVTSTGLSQKRGILDKAP